MSEVGHQGILFYYYYYLLKKLKIPSISEVDSDLLAVLQKGLNPNFK
jgi:hypothetical protein